MPKNLTAAGRKAAKTAAEAFLIKYADIIVTASVKVAKGAPKSEGSALAFFKGKSMTSGYNPVAFADARRGCETATVRLHPHPGWKDVELGGSKTVPLPVALDAVKKLVPGERFISGHMINADFGGDHTRAGNQTVLTHAANSQHHFDDSMKAACMAMGKVCYEMCRLSHAPDAEKYLNKLYKDWKVKIDVAVGNASWYDFYSAHPVLKTHKNVAAAYPLNAVATSIVFKATVENTPTVEDIAKNLKIDESKMDSIAASLAQFQQFISDAATFELKQPAPLDFGAARSLVSATTTTSLGVATNKASAGTLKPYKKK